MLYVGIDVAKNKHDVTALNVPGKTVLKPLTFSNNKAGFELLDLSLRQLNQDCLIALENTGHYAFNQGERDAFLISLKAGGVGLNLTGADTVILVDLWWNPAVEAQAIGRAHRMGQEETVEVYRLVTKGTIEEKIQELQEQKKHLVSQVLDGTESRGSLTLAEIREILGISEAST
ncbi:IS110 family transposase [Streptococcus pneumoniae]|uniref:IS110 family transposase n=1 Tax=Streptococcus pneumoniae TaxID=1313 RepID=UPI0005DCA173|nr:IS110 family transposase [Streptococcus pneumoniae]CEY60911.1 putative SNF-family helicase [Streptococcus pneumoniae]